MLVNYFCRVARQAQVGGPVGTSARPVGSSRWPGRLKSLAQQAQSADPAGSKRWPGRLKALARQTQVARPAGSRRWPGRLKALTRQAQSARPADSKRPATQSQKPDLFFPHLLVLQVPNMLRLVVDRDRLNLGVV